MICLKCGIQMHKVDVMVGGLFKWKCPICDKAKGVVVNNIHLKAKGVSYGQRLQSNIPTKDGGKKKPNAGTGSKGWSPRTKI